MFWTHFLMPFSGAAGILLIATPQTQQLLSIEVPSWAQVSVVFLVIFLLMWLIAQSQSRYDKLLARIDENDASWASLEARRLELEKERIVADVQQTAQIASLGRAIDRLEMTIKENTVAVIKQHNT